MSTWDHIAAMFDAIGKGYAGGILFMVTVIGIYLYFGRNNGD